MIYVQQHKTRGYNALIKVIKCKMSEYLMVSDKAIPIHMSQ